MKTDDVRNPADSEVANMEGIEALSRGAAFVTFVDKSRKSCALIEENLDVLNIPEDRTEIVNLQAETFSGRAHEKPWDIAFYDPPYDSN